MMQQMYGVADAETKVVLIALLDEESARECYDSMVGNPELDIPPSYPNPVVIVELVSKVVRVVDHGGN
jgi:hypothetical protein